MHVEEPMESATSETKPERKARSRKGKSEAELPGLPPASEDPAPAAKAPVPAATFGSVRVGVPRLEPKKIPGVPGKRDMIEVKIFIPGTAEAWRKAKALDGQTVEVRFEPLQPRLDMAEPER